MQLKHIIWVRGGGIRVLRCSRTRQPVINCAMWQQETAQIVHVSRRILKQLLLTWPGACMVGHWPPTSPPKSIDAFGARKGDTCNNRSHHQHDHRHAAKYMHDSYGCQGPIMACCISYGYTHAMPCRCILKQLLITWPGACTVGHGLLAMQCICSPVWAPTTRCSADQQACTHAVVHNSTVI